jgi:hypothetical protein
MASTPPRSVPIARTFAIPTSVDIFNVVVDDFFFQKPQAPDASADSDQRPTQPVVQWTRPQHTVDLLHRVRMEIQVTDAFVSRTLYSQATDLPRIHSSWKHIEESIEEASVTLDEGESLWLSFFLEGCEAAENQLAKNDSDVPHDRFSPPFLRISLEKLVRVHQELDTNVLPVNAVIITYPSKGKGPLSKTFEGSTTPSSGSTTTTRIPLSLHEILVGRSLLSKSSFSSSPVSPSSGLSSSRFDDLVFDTLDSVVPSPARPRIESLGGLADLSLHYTSAMNIERTIDDPECAAALDIIAVVEPPANMQDFELDEERREYRDLSSSLILETQALEHERELIRQRGALDAFADPGAAQLLMDLSQTTTTTKTQTRELHRATRELQMEVAKSQFLLEAQRIRIVRDLSHLFPITAPTEMKESNAGRYYRIRGLQLPNSAMGVWQGPFLVPEDELSAALGMAVHVLLCLGRYLSVAMRHPLGFQSSRSYVQDANKNTFYPLFTTRQDRDKFVAGWDLLETNADRVLLELRLSTGTLPLLGKIQKIYDAIVVGE